MSVISTNTVTEKDIFHKKKKGGSSRRDARKRKVDRSWKRLMFLNMYPIRKTA